MPVSSTDTTEVVLHETAENKKAENKTNKYFINSRFNKKVELSTKLSRQFQTSTISFH